MVRLDHTTPEKRAQLAIDMLAASGTYGAVTQLSRASGISRQTLYSWRDLGQQALNNVFSPNKSAEPAAAALPRTILTLLVEGHSTLRGLQHCLAQLGLADVSLGTIAATIQQAEQRAVHWLASHAPASRRSIALDEIYASKRGEGYLSIVDTNSWAVWAATGPVAVDGESWTLQLWLAQDSGLHWYNIVSDGGSAIAQAVSSVDPQIGLQRDVWHVLHQCSKVQGRLDRVVSGLRAQTATVARQAARLAAGQRPRGRTPQTDIAAHVQRVRQASAMAEGLRYLSGELRELLAVVVRRNGALLGHQQRQAEVEVLLELLDELTAVAPSSQQRELAGLAQHLRLALPGLLVFSARLEALQQQTGQLLGAAGLDLLAWSWQRRKALGYSIAELLDSLPVQWRGVARLQLLAWEQAGRASSAVENWHSILRPHLAVHRELSAGLIALLAVWHNHRVFARGEHAGRSPLQLSGFADASSDWLDALGYVPVSARAATGTPHATRHQASRAA